MIKSSIEWHEEVFHWIAGISFSVQQLRYKPNGIRRSRCHICRSSHRRKCGRRHRRLIGNSNGGWRGGYRGSAIGTIIGTIAGAAIGNAVSAPKQEEYGYRIERTEPYEPQPETYPAPSVFDNLKIRNIRFIDDNRDHVITSGESSKVIFEIMNEGDRTVYNVVPVVTETTGMKRIYISPSVMVEQIAPHNGVKYTANISAGERIKTGNITIRVAVANGNGQQYDRQEFSLPTER